MSDPESKSHAPTVRDLSGGTSLAGPRPESGPDSVDGYLVVDEIGQGGMGVVYTASDVRLERSVALKRLRGSDVGSKDWFVREARLTGQLEHPNIPPVHSTGLDERGRPYFTMKKVRGETLENFLCRRESAPSGSTAATAMAGAFVPEPEDLMTAPAAGAPSIRDVDDTGSTVTAIVRDVAADASSEADEGRPGVDETTDDLVCRFTLLMETLRVLDRVCDALAFAHDRGVIHCDLKPQNIMVGDFGQVYLMDWGVAQRLSEKRAPRSSPDEALNSIAGTANVFGTPAYMSPEQARGDLDALGTHSDIFAMGTILYRIVMGRPPFRSETIRGSLKAARACQYDPPEAMGAGGGEVPGELAAIIERAMAPDPADRYGSVVELQDDLVDFMRGGAQFPRVVFAPGEQFIEEGGPGDAAYVLISGTCEVTKGEEENLEFLTNLGPGAVLGETAILTGETRSASVRALTEVTAYKIDADSFEREIGSMKPWMSAFIRALAERFRDHDAKLSEARGALAGSNLVDEGMLGAGGMSAVRRVLDPVLMRRTALKLLRPNFSNSDAARERFLDEARVLAQLEHPNIPPVYRHGTRLDGRDYISMKLVTGMSMSERLATLGSRRLEPAALVESLEILRKVCDALEFAHAQGIVHRDLKPSNIMVGDYGTVYLVDWGIALRTGSGSDLRSVDAAAVLGTPTYMAPEQAEDPDRVDARADVYAAGGVLYAILTGKPPHPGKTGAQVLVNAQLGNIKDPQALADDPRLPASLSRICMSALQTDPEERPASIAAFREEIIRFLRGSAALPSRRFGPGEPIVVEGDAGSEAFVIRSGTCRVSQASRGVIRDLGPGEVFGELAILTERPRSSTVTAVDDVELLVVSRDSMSEGLGLDSWMGVFVRTLARRFAELEADRFGSSDRDP